MPVAKTKPKLKTKPGKSAGSLVARGHPTKSTKTVKKKSSSSPPSIDSGYSLYSTDSEDPVVYANRGLDRCAALLANILESDDSERIATKSQRLQKKTKAGAKPTGKAGHAKKKLLSGNIENKVKSQPKVVHTLTVPTATQDVDVSLSESPSRSTKPPINLSTDSRPMMPFKADSDIRSNTKEAPYNERLPSSTPLSTPPTLIQAEKEKQQLRDTLQQHYLPVNQRPQNLSPKHDNGPHQRFAQENTDRHQTLQSQLLQGYQNQVPVPPFQAASKDDASLHTDGRNLYLHRWLQDDPRGYHSDPVAYSNGLYQPATMERFHVPYPSTSQPYYQQNPNYGSMLPEKEYVVNDNIDQGYPRPQSYLPVTSQPYHMVGQPLQYHYGGAESSIGKPGVNLMNHVEPDGVYYSSLRHEQVPGGHSVNGSVSVSAAGSGPEAEKLITDGSSASDTTSTIVSGGPLTVDTTSQPDTSDPKPISPFRPNTSYDRSRSNSLLQNSQSDIESMPHNLKSTNEKTGTNRTPVKSPPIPSENQSHRRKSHPIHTVKYLLRELRAVNSMHGDIEVNRLLDEIDYTLNTLPNVKATSDIETEIGLALQPLRNENAQLRRRLRIVNQQLRERERVECEPTEGTIRFDLLGAQTLNATLQRHLEDDKKQRDKLLKRIEELKEKLQTALEERKKMLYLMDEKDNDHLKSREEWTLELSKMKIDAEQAISKTDSLQIRLEANAKENDILQLTLKQRDAEVARLKDLNENLQISVSNLLRDLESSKPSLGDRGGQYDVPQGSLQRLERLLRPSQSAGRQRSPVNDYPKISSERSGVRNELPIRAQDERSGFMDIPRGDSTKRDDMRTYPCTPTQNNDFVVQEEKSPAQRSLNFGISPEERRLKLNFGARSLSEDDDLAKTLTDADSYDYDDAYQRNNYPGNRDYPRNQQRSTRSQFRSNLTKENLEEHNKTFLDENREEYRLKMLTREKEEFSNGETSTPVNDKYGSTLSSGTLTPNHSGPAVLSQGGTRTSSQDGTLTPRNSRETSPTKGEPKMVTFSEDAHEEYYYDPKSKIQNTSKSTLAEKSSAEFVQDKYDHSYRFKNPNNSQASRSGGPDISERLEPQDEFPKPQYEEIHISRPLPPDPKQRFGNRNFAWEQSVMDEIGSITSGTTLSSVTSQDERQFRQGLANLDADIARLQSNLKQFQT